MPPLPNFKSSAPRLPRVTVPTERGRQARVDGYPMDSCPYPDHSMGAFCWYAAWIQEDCEIQESVNAIIHQSRRERSK